MFEVIKTEGRARRGVFTSPHGTARTPVHPQTPASPQRKSGLFDGTESGALQRKLRARGAPLHPRACYILIHYLEPQFLLTPRRGYRVEDISRLKGISRPKDISLFCDIPQFLRCDIFAYANAI